MGLDMYLSANGAELGYWRKANAIHAWFVKNVQNGIDECQEANVTREQLTELKSLCERVIAGTKLVPGNVLQSITMSAAGQIPNYIPGMIVEDPTAAIELLPASSGFFFGNTMYDEGYVRKLHDTVDFCTRALDMPDSTLFTYQSSW